MKSMDQLYDGGLNLNQIGNQWVPIGCQPAVRHFDQIIYLIFWPFFQSLTKSRIKIKSYLWGPVHFFLFQDVIFTLDSLSFQVSVVYYGYNGRIIMYENYYLFILSFLYSKLVLIVLWFRKNKIISISEIIHFCSKSLSILFPSFFNSLNSSFITFWRTNRMVFFL